MTDIHYRTKVNAQNFMGMASIEDANFSGCSEKELVSEFCLVFNADLSFEVTHGADLVQMGS